MTTAITPDLQAAHDAANDAYKKVYESFSATYDNYKAAYDAFEKSCSVFSYTQYTYRASDLGCDSSARVALHNARAAITYTLDVLDSADINYEAARRSLASAAYAYVEALDATINSTP